jgi:two-component system, chemotaxis family, chemotaxis protein CheY
MKALVVEDDAVSRKLLQSILSPHCDCHGAVDGQEAVDAFRSALDEDAPFDLICMDIMMPNMDGHEALTRIRSIEKDRGTPPEKLTKVIMTTALSDPQNVVKALYREGAATYIVKPVEKDRLLEELRRMGLLT